MHPTTLTDGRLVLRPPRPGDVEAVLRACRDPDVGRWTTVPSPYRRTDAEDWVLRLAPAMWAEGSHLIWYAVDPDAPDRLLASVALHHVDLEQRDAEVGYWAAPEARGRGVTTDAIRLLTRWAFDGLGLERIDWLAGVGNDASRRVAEKVGFVVEGTSRGRLVLAGRRHDAWVAGLLPGETLGERLSISATPADEAIVAPPSAPGPPVVDGPWLAVLGTEITAGALHLRPWDETDVGAVAGALVDPDIARWNPLAREGSAEDDARRYIDRANAGGHGRVSFAVVDATTGALLGCVALHHLDRGDGCGEAGYWTMPASRGRGVARAALGTVSRWAFGALGLERLELFHAVENDASCRVAEAAGFAHEATMRRSYRYGDGRRHDEHLHGRLAAD